MSRAQDWQKYTFLDAQGFWYSEDQDRFLNSAYYISLTGKFVEDVSYSALVTAVHAAKEGGA